MAADDEPIVRDCSELSEGQEIEAWHNGRLFHKGPVERVLPSAGLFWIKDEKTGSRKLLDVEALKIVRAEARVARDEVQRVTELRSFQPNIVWFSSA